MKKKEDLNKNQLEIRYMKIIEIIHRASAWALLISGVVGLSLYGYTLLYIPTKPISIVILSFFLFYLILGIYNIIKIFKKKCRDKEALTKITTAIVSEKVEKPKNLYGFRPDGIFEEKDLAMWFDYTLNFYHFAKRYNKSIFLLTM